MELKLRQKLEGFVKSQRFLRKDAALREREERGPIYVAKKLSTYYFGAVYCDLMYGWRKRVQAGKVPLGDRAAVYLIFPNSGVLQSHLDSLAYMRHKGYAAIVVSNVTLTDEDREILANVAHLVIERYNYGYDFGGYRDGILAMEAKLADLKHFAFFNDSCWFPVTETADWLGNAEAMDLDFVGASSAGFMRSGDLATLEEFKFTFDSSLHGFHYQSFALLCGPSLLRDVRFVKFWKKLPLSQLKRLTVRRGEVGLTQFVVRSGFSHGSTLTPRQLTNSVISLTDAELRVMLTNLPKQPRDADLSVAWAKLLATPGFDRNAYIDAILWTIARRPACYVIFAHMTECCNYAFLKKALLWRTADSSEKALTHILCLDGPYSATIRAEAIAMTKRAL